MSDKVDTGRVNIVNPITKLNEYEVEIHYEQKLRHIFFETASADGTIDDVQGWELLMAMFLKHRVVSIEDTKRLDHVRPSFPILF